jgi:AmiR/NasT family two-component response regulator
MTRPYRIVIADDEKPVAVGLQNQLESLGYDVVAVVNDGQRAIEMCRRALPDAVFLDIEMPGLDGLSAARQIAVDPGTPVIILTAHGHPNLIDQAVEDGVISYLLKPATNPSLHAAVQVAVARARELKALQEDVDELKSTLRERKLIERAKGILMSRRHLSESEAFRLLQRQSQDRRIPMSCWRHRTSPASRAPDPCVAISSRRTGNKSLFQKPQKVLDLQGLTASKPGLWNRL